jgi:hypothetical protein
MQNNNITLSNYNSLLISHIKDIAKFNIRTNDLLSSSTVADLFFEEMSKCIFGKKSGLSQEKLSNNQKILIIIKEIADCSKFYLNRLSDISVVFLQLIQFSDR